MSVNIGEAGGWTGTKAMKLSYREHGCDEYPNRALARAISAVILTIGAISCSDGSRVTGPGATSGTSNSSWLFVQPGVGLGPAWAGTSYVTPPTLRVLRSDGRRPSLPAPGVRVTFRVTDGAGTVRDTVVVTDGSGLASCGSWTLGPAAGVNTVTATVDSAGSVVFTTTAQPRPRIIATYVLMKDPGDTTVSDGHLLLGDDGSLEVSLSYTSSALIIGQPPVEPTGWTLLTYSLNGSTLSSQTYPPNVYGDVQTGFLSVTFWTSGDTPPEEYRGYIYVRSTLGLPNIALP